MCALAHAQSYSYNTKFTISKKLFVDSIPIEIEDDQIYLRALIHGKTYRFCPTQARARASSIAAVSFHTPANWAPSPRTMPMATPAR